MLFRSGNIIRKTQTLPLFVEQAYKQYETETAFAAAVLLACLGFVTLVLKEILERKTTANSVSGACPGGTYSEQLWLTGYY